MNLTRRTFLLAPGAIRLLQGPAPIGTSLPSEIKTFRDPETGRAIRQYTSAAANSYPLYYFIPTIMPDGRYAVLHSERGGWVQLYRLDLDSGAMVQLTAGTTRDSGWFVWCQGHLRGIFNHLSALNCVRREVYYFQDEELRSTHLDTLTNRQVMELPGRRCIGQSAFSPDGRSFAFIHADARLFRERMADLEALNNMGLSGWNSDWRQTIPCVLGAIDTATGRYRDVVRLDYHVHHVFFGDNQTLLVNHRTAGLGMWRINLDGTGRRDVRALDHQVVTARGIYYDVPASLVAGNTPGSEGTRNWLGRCDLATDQCEEVPLSGADGYAHTGRDPAGKFLFFENSGKLHQLRSFHFPFIPEKRESRLIRTLAAYPKPGGQRYHAHPFLSPDRKWLFHTAVIDGFSQFSAVNVEDLVDLDEYWLRRAL